MSRVATVSGDVDAADLGITTMHEHTICDLHLLYEGLGIAETVDEPEYRLEVENLAFLREGGFAVSDDVLYHNDDVDYMTGEFRAFAAAGGRTIVDASPIGLRGDVERIREAAERAGVNIVCCTGLYFEEGRPAETRGWSIDDMVRCFSSEIEDGIGESGIRPGFVKCAQNTVDYDTEQVSAVELDTIRAGARAAAEHGLSFHVHSNNVSDEQLLGTADMILGECGLPADRLVMLHMDNRVRSPFDFDRYLAEFDFPKLVTIDAHLALLDRGVSIGFDSWGSYIDYLPQDQDRMKALVELLRRGYAAQIVLGQDFNNRIQAKAYGAYGLTRILTYLPQTLKGLGFGQDTLDQMLVHNPARILAR